MDKSPVFGWFFSAQKTVSASLISDIDIDVDIDTDTGTDIDNDIGIRCNAKYASAKKGRIYASGLKLRTFG